MRYYDAMDVAERTAYEQVLDEIRTHNEPLGAYVLSKNSRDSMFLIDYGRDGNFDWHYDNEHPSCGRLLIAAGDGMVFEYVDFDGSIRPYAGNTSLFLRGTTTFHRARRTFEATRRVFAFQLCNGAFAASPAPRTLCNTLSSATLAQLAFTFLPYMFGFCAAHVLLKRIATVDVPWWVVPHVLLVPLHRYSFRTVAILLGFWTVHVGSLLDAAFVLVYLSLVDVHPFEGHTARISE